MDSTPENVQSLFQLHTFMRQVIALNFQDPVWVRAEIASLQESRGHIYLNLIEKEAEDVRAQASAVLWQRTYRRLKRNRGRQVDGVLRAGMEVQLQARVDFHEKFGYKLIVEDIDPEFTIGLLEQKKLETIAKLRQERLLEKNGNLHPGPVIQRIALISSPNAAGLEDFMQQIRTNPFGYQFEIQLFPASVQGQMAVKEILQQFQNIRRKAEKFDVAAILRGGGARTDLIAFDDEQLCRAAADLPIPLLTGIGHERDESVLDLVAFEALKTPTAVAEFILRHNYNFEAVLEDLNHQIGTEANRKLQHQQLLLNGLEERLEGQVSLRMQQELFMLDKAESGIFDTLAHRIKMENFQIDRIRDQLQVLGPEAHLERGYVRLQNANGKTISRLDQVKTGESVLGKLKDGTLHLRVDRKDKA
ncbi:MAG: exodeoxyribonuclease VII large subunit [Bacteroidetes bacterium]|nr:exodeoxyribonuclease VII large subunit [Bacteroidota bacterium]